MKIYISFGQEHAHRVNGVTIDKDCLVEIVCDSIDHGRSKAIELFGKKWSILYTTPKTQYFHRGVVTTL